MATDQNQMRDTTTVELNPADAPDPDYGPQPDPIPERPADNAKLDKWRKYVEALGAHPDALKDMKGDELRDLADRLGG